MNRYTKAIFIFLLAITTFHVSGIEAGFCDDGQSSQMSESHGCIACQPAHHSVTLEQPEIPSIEFTVSHLSSVDSVLRFEEPSPVNLRPPIRF